MRKRKLKFLAGAALAAALGLGTWVIGGTPAFTVHDTDLFELEDVDKNDSNPGSGVTLVPDANAEANDGPGDDWNLLDENSNDNNPNNDGDDTNNDDSSVITTGILHDEGHAEPNHPDVFSGTGNLEPEDIFTGGGTKDINDLNQWKWKVASGFPDKNDITHAYAAAYNCPAGQSNCTEGDLILYFGADRFTNNGDAFLGFWFFQQGITQVPGSPAGTFGGGLHVARDDVNDTPGDFLILVDYPQGSNADPILRVLEWVTSGGSVSTHLDEIFSSLDPGNSAECGDAAADQVCASTNDFSTASPWFYASKGSSVDGNFLPETFYEGGINITDLLGGAQLCLSAFMVETRSSESENATLKDFVLGNFSLCGIDVTKECTSADLNADGEVDLTFAGDVINTGALTVEVDLFDDPTANIDAVCFDTVAPIGDCTGADPVPANLVLGTTASFDLPGNETVRWEGSRTVTPPPGGFTSLTFEDTIHAEAFDGTNPDPVATAEATDDCTATETLSLVVTKTCSGADIDGGDTFVADIDGTITNNSDVKLLNIELNDSVFADTDFTFGGDCSGSGTAGDTGNDIAEMAIGAVCTFHAEVSSTTDTSHFNDLDVVGDSAITGDDATGSDDTAGDTCSVSPNPTLTVDKNCDTSFGGAGIRLVQSGVVVAVEAGAVITVTNTGTVDLTTVTLDDDNIANLSLFSGNGFTCNASGCTGSLDLGENATFKGSYLPSSLPGGGPSDPDSTSFTNTATAAGVGALGGATATGTLTDSDTCEVCQ